MNEFLRTLAYFLASPFWKVIVGIWVICYMTNVIIAVWFTSLRRRLLKLEIEKLELEIGIQESKKWSRYDE